MASFHPGVGRPQLAHDVNRTGPKLPDLIKGMGQIILPHGESLSKSLVSREPYRPCEAHRVAACGVKAGLVRIANPHNGGDRSDPATVTLTYVEVCEIDTP
jgi:hypothetical protein